MTREHIPHRSCLLAAARELEARTVTREQLPGVLWAVETLRRLALSDAPAPEGT
jgi:hypothetical protein